MERRQWPGSSLKVLPESQEALRPGVIDRSLSEEGKALPLTESESLHFGRQGPMEVGLIPKDTPLLTPGFLLGCREVREEPQQLEVPNHHISLS